MTTKQIFDRAVIVDVEKGLNDAVNKIQWPTTDAYMEYCRNQIVQALGVPKEFLFGDG